MTFTQKTQFSLFLVFTMSLFACSANTPQAQGDAQPLDKYALWVGETQLRGANIWQRVVRPALDGLEFLGAGHVGPPYVQEDFDQLAALGANYVNISYAGLFTETPPYELDAAIQANLDDLLEMIQKADMFAVISFRTGPGRSDFTFYREGAGDWFNPQYLIESVWQDQAAQDAWVEMWRYTAERYRNHPIVVGYDLMVEPNAAAVVMDIYEPELFYPAQENTLLDWNPFAQRIASAVREVDAETPIIVGAMGHSAAIWLPYLNIIDEPRIVYAVHQYEPFVYTHQDSGSALTYPDSFDIDQDGEHDDFSRAWLEDLITSTIVAFMDENNVPVTVNEFGVMRWAARADQFMGDQMALFEAAGINYAVWMFHPRWEPHQRGNDAFDFLHGADPAHHENVDDNPLLATLVRYWSRNTLRPSNFAMP